ncbi:MAG: cation:proton antiporter [Planctomycetaceae bacterium]|nr:cation:proton antiporter [Planctomycetaceae bacterium]
MTYTISPPLRPKSPQSRRPRPTYLVIGLVVMVVASYLFGTAPSSRRAVAADDHPTEVPREHPAEGTESADAPVTEAAGSEEKDKEEEHEGGGHDSPVAPVLAAIVLLLFSAKLAGDVFERLAMPAVLGELFIGVVLGNLGYLLGFFNLEFTALDFLRSSPDGHGDPHSTGYILSILAEIGVVLLLFEVGLESNVRDMLKVGASSLLVAILGVIAPMLLGIGVGWFFLPHRPYQVWLFLGATLCATSVGITARVLKDLGRSQQRESKIILGAAVIDDVLGLVVLAIVSGIIKQAGTGEALKISALALIVIKAIGFLIGAVFLGGLLTRPLFRAASYLKGHGLLVAAALVVCFGLAYLATLVSLAPIVGAFAGGLILEHAHYKDLSRRENVELEHAIQPLTALLVPIFFVQMGINVRLEQFLTNPSVWGLAAALTIVAIIGKQVCALGVVEPGQNRLAVGLGMIPRGEVGLIFANEGAKLVMKSTDGTSSPVIQGSTYAALVVMIMVTTMVTPPLLKWSLTRGDKPAEAA